MMLWYWKLVKNGDEEYSEHMFFDIYTVEITKSIIIIEHMWNFKSNYSKIATLFHQIDEIMTNIKNQIIKTIIKN